MKSPLYVMKLIRTLLDEQGIAGQTMNNQISRAFAQLSSNPVSVFPPGHKLTEEEIRMVKRRGPSEATSKTYRLVLEGLKRKATNKELMSDVNTLSQLNEWVAKKNDTSDNEGGWEVSKADRRKAKKTANSVATECSSLTMNTTVEGSKTKSKYKPCAVCRLYHDTTNGCQFVDKNKKKFRAQHFLKHGSVRYILPSGHSVVSDYWIDKLRQYIFPALDIKNETEKTNIIDELKKAAAELPRVTEEERKEWLNRNNQIINVAMKGAEGQELIELREQLSVLTNQVEALKGSGSSGGSKSRTKSRKSKRSKNTQEDDDSSDSSDDYGSTDLSDYSH